MHDSVAIAGLPSRRRLELLQLRSLNPHVKAIASEYDRHSVRGSTLRRQSAPAMQECVTLAGSRTACQGCCGVADVVLTLLHSALVCSVAAGPEALGCLSSFAYQGTNAHAVLCWSGPAVPPSALPPMPWQRSRLWFAAAWHSLLQRVASLAAQAGSAIIECGLDRPSLSFLPDHAIDGQACLPAAALLEMLSAAGRLLRSAEQLGSPVTTVDVASGAPVLLQLQSALTRQLLMCATDLRSGAVQLTTGAVVRQSSHMQARFASPAASMGQRQCGAGYSPGLNSSRHAAAALAMAGPAHLVAGSPPALTSLAAHHYQHAGYWVHPSIGEAALQLSAALALRPLAHDSPVGGAVPVAASLAAYHLLEPLPGHAAACASAGSARLACGGAHGATFAGLRLRAGSWADVQHAAAVLLTSLEGAAPGPAARRPELTLAAIEAQLLQLARRLGLDVSLDAPLMEGGLDSIGEDHLE